MEMKARRAARGTVKNTSVALTPEHVSQLRALAAEAMRRGCNGTVSAALRYILDQHFAQGHEKHEVVRGRAKSGFNRRLKS